MTGRSRMGREAHVRFWEGLVVRFSCATLLKRQILFSLSDKRVARVKVGRLL